jgi:hypothetical protein
MAGTVTAARFADALRTALDGWRPGGQSLKPYAGMKAAAVRLSEAIATENGIKALADKLIALEQGQATPVPPALMQ